MKLVTPISGTVVPLVPAIVIAACLALTPATAAETGSTKLSAEDLPVEAIEGIIRDYILKNPEILREASQILRQREREAKAARTKRGIAARRDELLNDPDSPVGGNPEGGVTIVEFFDYNCVYCRRTAPVLAEIQRQDPQVRLVYKEFPILGAGSVLAAQAALAARAQGMYLAFHEALMKAEGVHSLERIMEIAGAVGLETARLAKDMEDPAIMAAIDRNRALARALGARTTPSFVIGDRLARGAKSLAALQRLIRLTRSERAVSP